MTQFAAMSRAASVSPPSSFGRAATVRSPPEVAPHEQHERAEGQRPQDPVGEDLERPGRLERVEVEREQAPDAVGEEGEDRAAPQLAGVAREGRAHAPVTPTVQVSRPRSRAAEVVVGRAGRRRCRRRPHLGAHPVVVGRARHRPEDAHRHVRHLGGVEPRERERLARVLGAGVVHDDVRAPTASAAGTNSRRPPGIRTRTLRSSSGPTPTGSPSRRCTMRASCWVRSLMRSNAPSLKIGQFW